MAQFTLYQGTVTGQAGSLIAALDAALVTGQGWTKAFTGTNKAAYRAPTGNRLYLRVDDNGPGLGTFKEARFTGYETMSDVDTGTGVFPLPGQGVGNISMFPVRKSVSLDAVVRPYELYADERSFLFACLTGDVVGTVYLCAYFGEIFSYKTPSEDVYRTILIGRNAENAGSGGNETIGGLSTALVAYLAGHAMARSYTGSGSSIQVGKNLPGGLFASDTMRGNLQSPNGPDGGIYIEPVRITEASGCIRGQLRGIWGIAHPTANVNNGDTFSGVGALTGRTFRVLKEISSVGSNGGSTLAVEISNTLDTN